MSESKASISGNNEGWYLNLPSLKEPPQPYLSDCSEWPIKREKLEQIDVQAQTGNALGLNNLGLDPSASLSTNYRFNSLCFVRY
jgi:hypothetical protein